MDFSSLTLYPIVTVICAHLMQCHFLSSSVLLLYAVDISAAVAVLKVPWSRAV